MRVRRFTFGKLRERPYNSQSAAIMPMDFSAITRTIEEATEKAIGVLLPQLRAAIVSQVTDQLRPVLETLPKNGPERTEQLRAAVASMQEHTSQTDILVALLDGAERFSGRCGLLIVRGAVGVGWQAHGLDADLFKRVQVDAARGLLESAMQSQAMTAGTIQDFDASFTQRFGASTDGNCVLIPLCVRERVAAVLYADCGAKEAESLDVYALDILIRVTSLWLEALSTRQAPHPAPAAAAQSPVPAPAHVEPPPAPVAAPAPPPPPPQPVAAPVPPPPPSLPVPVATPAPAPTPAPAESMVDDELRNKARRFAKLLVEEIKLYNQAKVNDGRANHDLYKRLKDDIDKSRAAYRKRFGQYITDVDYFTNELIRILAENDRSLFGADFPG